MVVVEWFEMPLWLFDSCYGGLVCICGGITLVEEIYGGVMDGAGRRSRDVGIHKVM